MPAFLLAVASLVLSPTVRAVLFPSASVALIDSFSGEPTKPAAGILATTDSFTGAPENHKGEAVEHEANNFVRAVITISTDIMMDRDAHEESNAKGGERFKIHNFPPPCEIATVMTSAKDRAEGIDGPNKDHSKSPMETALWSQAQPLMHAITTVSDTWEKFAKYVALGRNCQLQLTDNSLS